MRNVFRRVVFLAGVIATALLLTPAVAAAQCTGGLVNTLPGAAGLEGCGGILPAVGSAAALAAAAVAAATHAAIMYVQGAATEASPRTAPTRTDTGSPSARSDTSPNRPENPGDSGTPVDNRQCTNDTGVVITQSWDANHRLTTQTPERADG